MSVYSLDVEEGLNPRQQAFVREYMVDLNATRAAIRAGYSEHAAKEHGYHLLTQPHVQAALEKRIQARSEMVEARAEDVVRELAAIAFSDLGAVADWDANGVVAKDSKSLPPLIRRTIKKVKHVKKRLPEGAELETVEVELHDKMAALAKLMKHLGMDAPKRVELSGPDGKPVEVKAMRGISDEAAAFLREKILGIEANVPAAEAQDTDGAL